MKPEVQDVIPQRYPFQMIDRFIDVKPGESASAVKLISINEWFFDNKSGEFGCSTADYDRINGANRCGGDSFNA